MDINANLLINLSLDGRPLKPLVDEAGLSSYRLAKLIGCDQALLSGIWKGKRSISRGMAESACEVLGVSFSDVFGPQLEAIGLAPIAAPARA